MTNKLHIILAGGKASRLGYLSKGVPKALMPLGNTTLLHRQVQQSIQNGSNNITIATNELFYNQIKRSLEDYSRVEVVYKTNDEKGPLSTLRNLLKNIDPDTIVLLTLGDIYFRDNPFDKFDVEINGKQIYLAAAKAFHSKDLSLGGIVFTDGSEVTSVIKKAIPKNKDGYKWSGTALFKAEIKQYLERFLEFDKREIEDFFEYCRQLGYKTSLIEIPDFINVNNSEDLQVATLYNLAETNRGILSKDFTQCADKIRKELINKQNG